MDSFSLEDIRDSFQQDVELQLDRLTGLSDRLTIGTASTSGDPFAVVREVGHALHGLVSMVRLRSMTDSTRVMSVLARLAQTSRDATLRRQLGREIELVGQTLRGMLSLELAGQSDAAWMSAQELRAQLAHRQAVLPKLLASVDESAGSGEGFLDDAVFRSDEPEPSAPEPDASAESNFLDDAFGEPPKPSASAAPMAAAPKTGAAAPAPSAPSSADESAFDFGEPAPEQPPRQVPAAPAASTSVPKPPTARPAATGSDFLFEGSFSAVAAVPTGAKPPAAPTASPVGESSEFGFFDESAPAARPAPSPATAGPATAGSATAGPAASASTVMGVPGLDAEELRATFREEVGESLPVLHGHLRSLFARSADREAAVALERVYHTIKGSAAIVGLTDASAQAKVLQDAMRAVNVEGRAVGLGFLVELLEQTNRLLETVGLPVLSAGDVAPPDPVRTSATLQEVFQTELSETLTEIAGLLAELRVAPPEAAARKWGELGQLLHRLRGSAALCQETQIADRVAQAKTIHRENPPTLAAFEQIAEMVRDLSRRLVPVVPVEPTPTHELAPAPLAPAPLASAPLASALLAPAPLASAPLAPAAPTEEFDVFDAFTSPPASSPLAPSSLASSPLAQAPAQPPRPPSRAEISAELWEVMEAEAQELLGNIEQVALNLNESPQPKRVLGELMGLMHTLKGAVNSAGLSETGRALHSVEDVLEDLLAADVLPPMRTVVRMLMQAQDSVRTNLRLGAEGQAEQFSPELAASVQSLQLGGGLTTLSEPAERGSDSAGRVGRVRTPDESVDQSTDESADQSRDGSADASRASGSGSDSQRTSRGSDSGEPRASRGSGSDSQPDSAAGSGRASSSVSARRGGDRSDRHFIRVASERLDRVMNLTGELVVNRARMLRRMSQLRHWQRDMTAGKDRISTVVESFRQQYEFNRNAPGAVGAGAATAGAAGTATGAGRASGPRSPRDAGRLTAIDPTGKSPDQLMAELLAGAEPLPGAARPAERQAASITDTGSSTSGSGLLTAAGPVFGELELDRYEDINILARRLQELGNDIAEIQSLMEETVGRLVNDFDLFGRALGDIQAEVTRARMVPVSQLFDRLRRPIYDAADRLGKLVRVVAVGENVDLDRTIIDELYLPMVHLVRNCVAHGIEGSDARRAAGKDPEGTVFLRATQESGQLILEVSDDGRGLDTDGIRSRAVRLGLIRSDEAVEEARLHDLIFTSGMSTATGVGAVSGRGVGGSVVRQEIQKLGGLIRVKSRLGLGAAFTIVLPLTLAIRRALLLEIAGEVYAVPLNFARRLLDGATPTASENGTATVICDGQAVAVWSLAELLGVRSATPFVGSGRLLVLRLGEQEAAFRIDRVLGQDDIVVKEIGAVVAAHPLLAGATLGGDGEVIPILDVAGLLEVAGRAAANRTDVSVAAAAVLPSRHADGALELRQLRRATASGQTLPIPPEPLPERDEAGDLTSGLAVPRSGPLRVLWADDSLSVRKVAAAMLRTLGVEAVLAVDGRDAREKLREANFDLVFTDLEMPRMNGYELIREIRRDPAHASVPVVVVTSRSSDKHKQLAFSTGANDYLTKPFTTEQIQEKLAAHKRVEAR